jgi:hypothetical protein
MMDTTDASPMQSMFLTLLDQFQEQSQAHMQLFAQQQASMQQQQRDQHQLAVSRELHAHQQTMAVIHQQAFTRPSSTARSPLVSYRPPQQWRPPATPLYTPSPLRQFSRAAPTAAAPSCTPPGTVHTPPRSSWTPPRPYFGLPISPLHVPPRPTATPPMRSFQQPTPQLQARPGYPSTPLDHPVLPLPPPRDFTPAHQPPMRHAQPAAADGREVRRTPAQADSDLRDYLSVPDEHKHALPATFRQQMRHLLNNRRTSDRPIPVPSASPAAQPVPMAVDTPAPAAVPARTAPVMQHAAEEVAPQAGLHTTDEPMPEQKSVTAPQVLENCPAATVLENHPTTTCTAMAHDEPVHSEEHSFMEQGRDETCTPPPATAVLISTAAAEQPRPAASTPTRSVSPRPRLQHGQSFGFLFQEAPSAMAREFLGLQPPPPAPPAAHARLSSTPYATVKMHSRASPHHSIAATSTPRSASHPAPILPAISQGPDNRSPAYPTPPNNQQEWMPLEAGSIASSLGRQFNAVLQNSPSPFNAVLQNSPSPFDEVLQNSPLGPAGVRQNRWKVTEPSPGPLASPLTTASQIATDKRTAQELLHLPSLPRMSPAPRLGRLPVIHVRMTSDQRERKYDDVPAATPTDDQELPRGSDMGDGDDEIRSPQQSRSDTTITDRTAAQPHAGSATHEIDGVVKHSNPAGGSTSKQPDSVQPPGRIQELSVERIARSAIDWTSRPMVDIARIPNEQPARPHVSRKQWLDTLRSGRRGPQGQVVHAVRFAVTDHQNQPLSVHQILPRSSTELAETARELNLASPAEANTSQTSPHDAISPMAHALVNIQAAINGDLRPPSPIYRNNIRGASNHNSIPALHLDASYNLRHPRAPQGGVKKTLAIKWEGETKERVSEVNYYPPLPPREKCVDEECDHLTSGCGDYVARWVAHIAQHTKIIAHKKWATDTGRRFHEMQDVVIRARGARCQSCGELWQPMSRIDFNWSHCEPRREVGGKSGSNKCVDPRRDNMWLQCRKCHSELPDWKGVNKDGSIALMHGKPGVVDQMLAAAREGAHESEGEPQEEEGEEVEQKAN